MTPRAMFVASCLQLDRIVSRRGDEPSRGFEAGGGDGKAAAPRDPAPFYREEVESYLAKRYVVARESYDPDTVHAEMDLVAALTVPAQSSDRRNFHNGAGGFHPPFGSTALIEVAAGSVSFAGGRRAVVPFSTRRVFMMSGNSEPSRHWIAIIGFSYGAPALDAEVRRFNHWGFQVTSYRRVDLASIVGEEGRP